MPLKNKRKVFCYFAEFPLKLSWKMQMFALVNDKKMLQIT